VQERECWFWLRRIAPGSIARCEVLGSFEVDLLWSRRVAQLNAARCAVHVLVGAWRRMAGALRQREFYIFLAHFQIQVGIF
ncbi:hypothetical protein A2U01_0065284, partial [Trifolium medium]|nr:hypothetical protein [Trifolium medium]